MPYLYNSSAAVLESDGLTPLLFEALEAAEVEHTICAATASKAWRLVLGTMPSADPTDVADSDLIVVWGANPTVSNSHLAPRIEARAREGAKVVVIDPRRTPAADRASRFLPVKPGTDVVLAMAAAAELERRGAVDRAFVDEHAEGADEYLAACAEWTVERAAEVCGLEPEDITGFVDDIVGAQAPMLRVGWGMERNRNGGSAHRATMSLWVLAGAFGRPGAGVVGATSPAEDPTEGAVRNAVLGGGAYPNRRIVNMNRFGAVLAGEGGPVDVLFVQGSNPAASAPNQPAVHEGLAREDLFTVVHDQVMTDTARFADIVLPATTSFEVDDIVAGYGGYWVQDSPAVIPPVGESRPNNQVAHGLAVRLGFESEAFDPSPARLRELMVGPFELPLRLQPEGAVQFRDLWPAHAGSDSRRARLVTDDPTSDRLPTYRENDVTGGSLILLTPATNRTITSMFGEYDSSDPSVHLNPADAGVERPDAGPAGCRDQRPGVDHRRRRRRRRHPPRRGVDPEGPLVQVDARRPDRQRLRPRHAVRPRRRRQVQRRHGRGPAGLKRRVQPERGQTPERTASATRSSQVAGVPPVELHGLGPAEEELDVVLEGEADAAPDLLGHGGDVAEGLVGEELGHGGELVDRPPHRPRPRGLVDEDLGAVDPGDGVGQVVGQGLEGADGLAELLAVLGVLVGDVEGVAGPAHGGGGLEDGAVEHDPVPGLPASPPRPWRPRRRRGRPGTGCRRRW